MKWAVVGKVECVGKLYDLIPKTYDNYVDAQVLANQETRFPGAKARTGACAVIPANCPWIGRPLVWVRTLWMLFSIWDYNNNEDKAID